jgi:hypothetical protein
MGGCTFLIGLLGLDVDDDVEKLSKSLGDVGSREPAWLLPVEMVTHPANEVPDHAFWRRAVLHLPNRKIVNRR